MIDTALLDNKQANALAGEICSKMVHDFYFGMTNLPGEVTNMIVLEDRYMPSTNATQTISWNSSGGSIKLHAYMYFHMVNDETKESREISIIDCPFRTVADTKYSLAFDRFATLEMERRIVSGNKKGQLVILSQSTYEIVRHPEQLLNFLHVAARGGTVIGQMIVADIDMNPYLKSSIVTHETMSVMPLTEMFVHNAQVKECLYCQKYIPELRKNGKIVKLEMTEDVARAIEKARERIENFKDPMQ